MLITTKKSNDALSVLKCRGGAVDFINSCFYDDHDMEKLNQE